MPHSTYLPERMGTAIISPNGAFEAGSYQSFSLVYTAGYFGIDDTGSIKIVHRFASDMGRPQWSDPQAANYTTVEASNGAVLVVNLHGSGMLVVSVARRLGSEGPFTRPLCSPVPTERAQKAPWAR